jgi:hypothetical protein
VKKCTHIPDLVSSNFITTCALRFLLSHRVIAAIVRNFLDRQNMHVIVLQIAHVLQYGKA